MGQPYIGEIRMFAGNFAPMGWQFCDGSLLPIAEYDALFNLIGTTYGGDGQETFAVPDLRGRIPLHMGSGAVIGETMGTETVTLTTQQIPAHSHAAMVSSNNGSGTTPIGAVLARNAAAPEAYTTDTSVGLTPLNPASISQTGNSQPHDNMMPFLCVSFIISLFGLYPSPN